MFIFRYQIKMVSKLRLCSGYWYFFRLRLRFNFNFGVCASSDTGAVLGLIQLK